MLSESRLPGSTGFPSATATAVLDENPSVTSPRGVLLYELLAEGNVDPKLEVYLGWMDQLLDEVHRMHTLARPVIHGAISPATVMVQGDKLTLLKRDHEKPPSPDPEVNYKPIEQLWDVLDPVSRRVISNQMPEADEAFLSQPLSPVSDIYAVGAVAYVMSTGKAPTDALDRIVASMEGKDDPLVSPRAINESVPPEVSEIILKAMSLRPDERHYSALILRQIFRTAAVRIKERLAEEAATHLDLASPVAPEPMDHLTPIAPEPKVLTYSESDAEKDRELALRILSRKKIQPESEPVLEIAETVYEQKPEAPPVEVEAIELQPIDGILIVEPEPLERKDDEPHQSKPATSFEPSILTDDVPKQRSLAVPIAGAVMAVAACIGGALYFMNSGVSTPAAAKAEIQAAAMVELPAATPQPTPEQVPSVSSEPLNAASSETASAPVETKAVKKEPARAVELKTAAPSPAKPAKSQPKKALTVDDLINDN